MTQECSVIVRYGVILLLLNFVILNSFPRLSEFTNYAVKHLKYSIKLTT